MIFSDLEKLKEVKSRGKIQLIFAGKAHPKDEMGKILIKDIYEFIRPLERRNRNRAGRLDAAEQRERAFAGGRDPHLAVPQGRGPEGLQRERPQRRPQAGAERLVRPERDG